MHIFEGHLRQEPPFDPEIITFGDDVPSARGNTFAFRSKRSAPFFCALIAIRRRSQKRSAFEGNGTAADINSKERERESYIALLLKRAGFDRRLSHTQKTNYTLLFLLACVNAKKKRKMQPPLEKMPRARTSLGNLRLVLLLKVARRRGLHRLSSSSSSSSSSLKGVIAQRRERRFFISEEDTQLE